MAFLSGPIDRSIVLVVVVLALSCSCSVYGWFTKTVGFVGFVAVLMHTLMYLYRYSSCIAEALATKVPSLATVPQKIRQFQGLVDNDGIGLGFPVPERSVRRPQVLITGGAMGLGYQTATAFVALGHDIVIWDINPTALREAQDKLVALAKGRSAIRTAVVDVSSEESVNAAIAASSQCFSSSPVVRFWSPDIVILNAGLVNGKSIQDTTTAALQRLFAVNVFQLFHVTRALLPEFIRDCTRRRHIVVIGSIAGFAGAKSLADYTASKAAANIFTEALQMEIQNYNHLSATLVCPYLIDTGMFAGTGRLAMIPPLTPDEVAQHIIRSVQYRRRLVVIPWLFNAFVGVKALLPTEVMKYIAMILGAHSAMNTFTGRAPAPAATPSDKKTE